MNLQKTLEQLRSYDRLIGISEIARRYFAMNAFDGTLTMIGILSGCWIAQIEESSVIVTTGMMTAIAMGVSGLWGAYLTESAERGRAIKELNEVTLSDMNNTRFGRASRFAAVAVAIVDALSPFLASVIILLPFIFSHLFPFIAVAYAIAICLALLLLFLLGVFLGHISQDNRLVFGLKTLLAGLISLGISYLLGG